MSKGSKHLNIEQLSAVYTPGSTIRGGPVVVVDETTHFNPITVESHKEPLVYGNRKQRRTQAAKSRKNK